MPTIYKQTKNRNETGSNLSLGTRLTVLSKRLGRKRCCDTTPDRCLECNRLTILTAHCYRFSVNELAPPPRSWGGVHPDKRKAFKVESNEMSLAMCKKEAFLTRLE